MIWILFAAGSILGGILSALSRRDRDNVFWRLLSLAVPLAFGAVFWYLQLKSGQLFSLASKAGDSSSNMLNLVISTVMCALLSKVIGILIVKYFELKR